MIQIRSVGVVPETPSLPGAAEPDVPRVLGEIREWQSSGRLSQLTDGRYYMADTEHENVHTNRDRCRGECHTNSHKDNHTDYEDDRTRRHVDRGPKPPKKPEPPDRPRRDW